MIKRLTEVLLPTTVVLIVSVGLLVSAGYATVWSTAAFADMSRTVITTIVADQ